MDELGEVNIYFSCVAFFLDILSFFEILGELLQHSYLLVHITRFRCNTDCKNDPENCIGERLFRAMGDMLVLGGFQVTVMLDGMMVMIMW